MHAPLFCSLLVSGYSGATPGHSGAPRVAMEGSTFKAQAASPWTMTDVKAPGTDLLELSFMIKQTNVEKLEATLLAVSDPSSPSYGQHLTNAAVHELVKPLDAAIEAVEAFLTSHGAQPQRATPNGDMITAVVTFAQAEEMLGATYMRFEHRTGLALHRTLRYSLPRVVAEHVDLVAPTVHLPAVRTPKMDGCVGQGLVPVD